MVFNDKLLQHDNARPYTSAATRKAIQRLDFSVMPHPPYGPDLAPSDFHLFPKLKEHLRGQHFSCDEEVKSAVRKLFQKTPNFLRKDLKKECSVGRSVFKCVVILWGNNYADLKIIDVGIFLFF
jgi:transposase